MAEPTQEQIDTVTKAAGDAGTLIEAGWIGFRMTVYPDGAPQEQLDQMRETFFAGAQHTYASIMRMLDPCEQETPDDLRRMRQIDAELQAFITDYKMRHVKTAGRA